MIMASITALEAKTRLGEIPERVAAGEEVIITRHAKAVARLRSLRSRIAPRDRKPLTTDEIR